MPPKNGPVHLVLLHSNDIHGAFAPEIKDGIRTGGLSMLSGYVHKTKREEKNVLYVVAGDMFMGSIIDSEYRGCSLYSSLCLYASLVPQGDRADGFFH